MMNRRKTERVKQKERINRLTVENRLSESEEEKMSRLKIVLKRRVLCLEISSRNIRDDGERLHRHGPGHVFERVAP